MPDLFRAFGQLRVLRNDAELLLPSERLLADLGYDHRVALDNDLVHHKVKARAHTSASPRSGEPIAARSMSGTHEQSWSSSCARDPHDGRQCRDLRLLRKASDRRSTGAQDHARECGADLEGPDRRADN
jgi:hypothetical protein